MPWPLIHAGGAHIGSYRPQPGEGIDRSKEQGPIPAHLLPAVERASSEVEKQEARPTVASATQGKIAPAPIFTRPAVAPAVPRKVERPASGRLSPQPPRVLPQAGRDSTQAKAVSSQRPAVSPHQGADSSPPEADRPTCPHGCATLAMPRGSNATGVRRWRCPACQRSWSDCLSGHKLAPAKLEALIKALESGLSRRAAAEVAGVSKTSADKYARASGRVFLCKCGKDSSHRGWCSWRLSRTTHDMHKRMRQFMAAETPEERSALAAEAGRASQAKLTREERQRRARLAVNSRTPEQRSTSARQSAMVRRTRQAVAERVRKQRALDEAVAARSLVVDMRSGGTITLSVSGIEVAGQSAEDRAFVFELFERLELYGGARPCGASASPAPTGWRPAGPIRNGVMVSKADALIAFPGDRGTSDVTKKARAKGIPVVELP